MESHVRVYWEDLLNIKHGCLGSAPFSVRVNKTVKGVLWKDDRILPFMFANGPVGVLGTLFQVQMAVGFVRGYL